jgi:N-acetylmuramoyl-L-alanine amidase
MLLNVRKVHLILRGGGPAAILRRALMFCGVSAILFAFASQNSVNGISFGKNAAPAQNLSTLNSANAAPAQNAATQRPGLNIVVLDPAHGGIDPGARGTGGIRESEVALAFVAQIRRALELQGLQVVQTRLGNEDPSFDDRSAIANAQRGAVFVTVHISSTGLPGTVRVYVNSDMPPLNDAAGLLPWDQAQAPFLGLSRKLGDTVQGLLAQQFKGSPTAAQTAPVRQLRTTAAPAIAVEISSVTVAKLEDLERMAPGVADAIARGVVAFKPSYVLATAAGAAAVPFSQPIGAPLPGMHP